MTNNQFHSRKKRAGAYLHLAAGIAGRQSFRARLLDRQELLV
jgi:hypothetical protein